VGKLDTSESDRMAGNHPSGLDLQATNLSLLNLAHMMGKIIARMQSSECDINHIRSTRIRVGG